MMETNQSVTRALQILETLAGASGPLGVREIARAIGVAPSIAQRLMATLAQAGFAEQDHERRYGLGARMGALAGARQPGNALVRESLPELEALAGEHRFNAYLGVLRGNVAVYLLACQSSGPIAINVRVGASAPLHATALGKVLLSGLDAGGAKRLLGREPYRQATPRTVTRWAALQLELARVRRTGHAISAQENLQGIFAIGAPLFDDTGTVVGAISGALPVHEVTAGNQAAHVRLITEAARRISRRLGAPATKKAA